jgi:hypothetical protein
MARATGAAWLSATCQDSIRIARPRIGLSCRVTSPGPALRVDADPGLDRDAGIRRELDIRDRAHARDQNIAGVLALLGAHDQFPADRLDELDLDPELEADAVALMERAREIADNRRHRAAHQPRRQLQDGDLGAELRRGGRDLEADKAAADQHERAARLELGANSRGVLEAAQIMNGQVIEGGEPPRAASRGDQQLVVGEASAVGELHVLRRAIDPRRGRAELERDALLSIKALGLQQQCRGRQAVGEISLGERRALIRRVPLVAHQRDLGIGRLLPQHLRRAKPRGPGADDHQLQRHDKTKSGASFDALPTVACSG